jgi:hypothetical protein
MKRRKTSPRKDPARSLTVRVSPINHQKLKQLAPMAGFASPAAYLRHLAETAVNTDRAKAIGGRALPRVTPANDELRPVLDQVYDVLRQLDEATRRLNDSSAPTYDPRQPLADMRAALTQLDEFVRATLRQSTAASYMGVTIWRMLAEQQIIPPKGGLPPSMLADIERLHGSIMRTIERDVGS